MSEGGVLTALLMRDFEEWKKSSMEKYHVSDDSLAGSRRGLLLAREVLLELKRCI